MKIDDALRLAPAAPACFPDRLQWAAYLLQCQMESGPRKKDDIPFDPAGRYIPTFNFCRDCTREHREAMRADDRCHPPEKSK
jgi:hypothetical protein